MLPELRWAADYLSVGDRWGGYTDVADALRRIAARIDAILPPEPT